MKRLLARSWYLLALLPIIFTVTLTLKYSVHAPFWDQWELVKLFQAKDQGSLSFSDFWAQHNEHRILFPNLALFLLGLVTHWDPYYEVVVSLIFACAILATIYLLIKRTFRQNKLLLPLFSILAAWLIFSPAQSDNWLWGWQAEWYMSVFGVVTAFWALTSKKLTNGCLIIALVGGTLATYSLGNGMLIWPIGLLILLLIKTTWRQRMIWTGVGLVEIVLYYTDYVNPGYEPSKTLWLDQPINFTRYVLIYLGRPLALDFKTAHFIGAALLALFLVSILYLWFCHRKTFIKQLAWFGIGLYALSSALVTAMSRMGFGLEQAYSSRYTTISVLFTLATIILTVTAVKSLLDTHKAQRVTKVALGSLAAGLLIPLIILSYYLGFDQMRQLGTHLDKMRTCLVTVSSPDDPCLALTYPNPNVAWERLEYLKSVNMGGIND